MGALLERLLAAASLACLGTFVGFGLQDRWAPSALPTLSWPPTRADALVSASALLLAGAAARMCFRIPSASPAASEYDRATCFSAMMFRWGAFTGVRPTTQTSAGRCDGPLLMFEPTT